MVTDIVALRVDVGIKLRSTEDTLCSFHMNFYHLPTYTETDLSMLSYPKVLMTTTIQAEYGYLPTCHIPNLLANRQVPIRLLMNFLTRLLTSTYYTRTHTHSPIYHLLHTLRNLYLSCAGPKYRTCFVLYRCVVFNHRPLAAGTDDNIFLTSFPIRPRKSIGMMLLGGLPDCFAIYLYEYRFSIIDSLSAPTLSYKRHSPSKLATNDKRVKGRTPKLERFPHFRPRVSPALRNLPSLTFQVLLASTASVDPLSKSMNS